MFVVDIDTYWNVEVLWQFLNAVSAVMSHSTFKSAAKLMFMLGLLFGVLQWAQAKHQEWLGNFFMAYVVFMLMTVAQSTVIISDKSGLEPPRNVNNVPTVLAWTAKISNTLMSWATVKYESAFSIPIELGLPQGDLAFGHRLLRQVGKAQLVDPALRADLIQFFKECTLFDVKDGAITPDMLTGTVNTWATVFANTSDARFVTYSTLSAAPVTDTCKNAASISLAPRLTAAVQATQQFYGRSVFTRASSNAVADAMYASAVQSSYGTILGLASNASDAIKQGVFNTLWREAGTELPAILNDPARVAEMNALASASIAAQSANGSHATVAILAQETLPHVRNWIEAIIIALFPIIVLMMIVADNNTRKSMFKGYVMAFVWIGLWPVMFALLNHLSLLVAAKKAAALKLATLGGVPFQLSDVFDASLMDEQTMLGYAVIMVPFLSGAVVRIASGQITQLADRMSATLSSAGAQLGGESAKGNFSMGNSSLDAVAVNNTSMNRYDSTVALAGAGYAIGRGDGGTVTLSAGGNAAMQQMRNNLVRRLSFSDTSSSSSGVTGSNQHSAGERQGVDQKESSQAGFSQVKGTGSRTTVSRGNSSSTAINVSGGTSASASRDRTQRTDDSTTSSAHTGITQTDGLKAHGALQMGGAGGAAGGTSVGSGAGYSAADQQRVASTMRSQGASEAQVEAALSQMKGGRPNPKRGSVRGLPLSAAVGIDTSRSYSTSQSRSWSTLSTDAGQSSAGTQTNYGVQAQLSSSQTGGTVWTEDRHQASTASQSESTEVSKSKGAYRDDGISYQEAARQEHGLALGIQHDLANDPAFFEKVARFNGMSATRLMNRNEDELWGLIQNYAAYKFAAVQAMPQQLPGGGFAPAGPGATNARFQLEASRVGTDVMRRHSADVRRAGYSGTGGPSGQSPIPAAAGKLIDATKEATSDRGGGLGPSPVPAAPSEAPYSVRDFTGAGEEVGKGKLNPAGKNEDLVKHDIQGTGNQIRNSARELGKRLLKSVGPKPPSNRN